MAYMKQEQLPTVSTNKIGFNYSAITVSDGGCTIAVYKDRHVYLFPTLSPTIASCILQLPDKLHKLNRKSQISTCKKAAKCHLLNDNLSQPIESHGKIPILFDQTVNYIKFALSGQLIFVAGPKIFCLFNLEQLDNPCILNINLFEIYNKLYKCCHNESIDNSQVLLSIDILCYRNDININNTQYQLIDIIASYKPLKPLFIRFFINEFTFFIDCKKSYEFNDYLAGLHRKWMVKLNFNEAEDEIFEVFSDINDQNESQTIGNPYQNYNFPTAVALIHNSKNSRMLHQAMSLNSIIGTEFEKILNNKTYLSNFNHEYGAELVLVAGPRHLCIITIIYNCQGLFIKDDDSYSYKCLIPPDCKFVNVEFVQMPWRNHLPKSIYSHPKIEMFAVLFPDRFFILTNQHYARSDSCESDDIIPLYNRKWFVKYHFIEPIIKQNCFFGAFSGEPLNNYFICTWKTTFSYEIALYDNRADTGLAAKRLILNTSKYRGLIQFAWVPNYRIIVGIGGFNGELIYISPKKLTDWVPLIPDFFPINQNIEYIEHEDDFDTFKDTKQGNYMYNINDIWTSPWEPISYKLGINKFKFYDIQYILSYNNQHIDDDIERIEQDYELPAERLYEN